MRVAEEVTSSRKTPPLPPEGSEGPRRNTPKHPPCERGRPGKTPGKPPDDQALLTFASGSSFPGVCQGSSGSSYPGTSIPG